MAEGGAKTCYYEVLGLDKKCTDAEIKAAYRKLALKWHPDKHRENKEEATAMFQIIQEAHSTISDPQERAWYDSHKDQILLGQEPGDAEDPCTIDFKKYYRRDCFSAFDDSETGFFKVYATLFEELDHEEEMEEDADEYHVAPPELGNSTSPWVEVSKFYSYWLNFSSRKTFAWKDKWNLTTAENRQVRRLMEQENKKERAAAKRQFNTRVRGLVQYIKSIDVRLAAYQKKKAQEEAEKKEAEIKAKQQHDIARKAAREQAQRDAEARWEEIKQERRDRGEASESESEEEETLVFHCEACCKTFKSERAFSSHENSKKHKEAIKQLREQLLREEAAMEAVSESEEEVSSCESSSEEEVAPPRPASSAESSSDSESDDSDYFGNFGRRNQFKIDSSESESESDASEEDAESDAEAKDAESDAEVKDAESDAEAKDAESDAEAKDAETKDVESEKEENDKVEEKGAGDGKNDERHLSESCKVRGESESEAPLKDVANTKKKPRRKKGAEPKAKAKIDLESEDDDETRCQVCKNVFASRNQLFQHIKKTGHAALKEAPTARGQGRKKKR